MSLLDLLEPELDARADWTHVCLPAMNYVCGGSILGLVDGGPGGHQVFGVGTAAWTWDQVTCPDCRRPGHREVARLQHMQQRPTTHVCDGCAWMAITAATPDGAAAIAARAKAGRRGQW